MTSVAAFGGSAGGGMGGSDDEGDYDKRMRVVTDFVGSSSSDDPDDEETDEEGETTESKVERRNSDLRKLTLDHDLPPNLHKRKLTIKIKYGGKSRSTVSLEEMGKSAVRPVTVKKRRLSSTGTLSPRITRASSAPIPALPPHLAEDSDQDAYVDIIGVSDEDEEIVQNQNQNLQIVEVGNKEKKKNKKKKKKNMRSKKRSKK